MEETVATLRRMGVAAVSYHHEVAPSQHEVDFEADDALRAADNVITLKYVLKAMAPRHGFRVSFMPKPFEGINGSGMHTLQRLSELTDAAVVQNQDDEFNYRTRELGGRILLSPRIRSRHECAR